ncbi:MAG: 23S rRNA (guanosine(2251)-2'-O)-methyltransferase RlmB [Thermodesulfovibrionales bacterium]
MNKAEEWIYGINPVIEAIRSGREISRIYISRGRKEKLNYILQEASRRHIVFRIEDKEFFESRFPKGHQGIAALTKKRGYFPIEDLLNIPLLKNEDAFFVILDCIEDPRNVGAIIRTAEAAGVHGIVMQAYRSASLGPEVVKTSAGASEYMPVSIVPNIKHAIKSMKDKGILIIGAEAGNNIAPWEADLTGSVGVVIGSEGKGLRRTVKDDCDIILSIPMKGRINSLNVSVATGILLFEILRQKLLKPEKL